VGFVPGMQGWSNIQKSINIIHCIYRQKKKNHMLMSIDSGITFDKMQHVFMKIKKKKTQKTCNRRNFLSLIKIIYKNPVTNITLNGKRLDILPLRLGRR